MLLCIQETLREIQIDIRHKLLKYTNTTEQETNVVVEVHNTPDANGELKNAILNVEKIASEAKLIVQEMQEKMSIFEAELKCGDKFLYTFTFIGHQ